MARNNAVLIDKDIASALTASETGDSEVINLFNGSGGALKFSCQAVYTVGSFSNKNFTSGTQQVDTFGFQAKASTNSGDYLVVFDTAGLAWAAAADLTGSDPAPSGAAWTAIPSGRKVQVNLSAATDAASVATAFATALTGLSGVTFSSTPSTSNVGCTITARGVCTSPAVHNANDSGDGTITAALTTPGVAPAIDLVTNAITISSHGYNTGLVVRASSTGTLPTGLATSTDYYVISVGSDTIKLASSYNNAVAGTAIDITGYGSNAATNTLTPTAISGGTVTFYASNDGINWVTLQSATSVSSSGSTLYRDGTPNFRYFKVTKALTTGGFALQALLFVVGDAE
jgi:hypothetical protein